jgi:hypothetical protein
MPSPAPLGHLRATALPPWVSRRIVIGPMDFSSTTMSICRMPIDKAALRDVSPVELVRRSGYLEDRNAGSIAALVACLSANEDVVAAWIRWSEDWRGSPQWYIETLGNGQFEVGYFVGSKSARTGPDSPLPVRYNDPTLAVAAYIHHHIADLASQLV